MVHVEVITIYGCASLKEPLCKLKVPNCEGILEYYLEHMEFFQKFEGITTANVLT